YQTALDLLERGYSVFMVQDAVCSRNSLDYKSGLRCAAQAGVTVCTAEMVLFQLLKKAGGAAFKAISALVKAR
ncbi:MAG: hydrolase, partial [Desulfuromonas sp.]